LDERGGEKKRMKEKKRKRDGKREMRGRGVYRIGSMLDLIKSHTEPPSLFLVFLHFSSFALILRSLSTLGHTIIGFGLKGSPIRPMVASIIHALAYIIFHFHLILSTTSLLYRTHPDQRIVHINSPCLAILIGMKKFK